MAFNFIMACNLDLFSLDSRMDECSSPLDANE